MELRLNEAQKTFMAFLIEERRSQLKAIQPLWSRHHRQDAKRLIDGFPYDKGQLIPYMRNRGEEIVLIWDPYTHNDLIADLRDHLSEREQDESHGSVSIVHEILAKIESLTQDANAAMTDE